MRRKKMVNSDLSPKTASAVRAADAARAARGQGRSLAVAVSTRQPTPQEQRRFHAAADVFLAELVRRRLRCGKD